MNVPRILLAEICYRKLNFALSLLAIMIAATLLVAGPILVDGYTRETTAELAGLEQRIKESAGSVAAAEATAAEQMKRLGDETRRLMRDLGFNLMLVDRNTDIVQFLATKVPTIDMPQQYVERLAKDTRLTMVTHLVATLRGKGTWEGREVLLAGYLPETRQTHMEHDSPMGCHIEPGTVLLGYRLGEGKQVGQTVEVGGQPFRIAQILPEQGTEEDTAIALHLADAQAILHKPEKINLILALECRCPESALPEIRRQMANVLPQAQVLRDNSKAEARARQRKLVAENHRQIIATQKQVLAERQRTLADTTAHREKVQGLMATLAAVITPLVLLAAAVWVGLLALANVRERRTEIGLLRALGKGSGTIASLFLGKAVLLGVIGAAAGTLLGTCTAWWLGLGPLGLSPEHFVVNYPTLLVALLGAPLLSAVASYLPTLSALLQDPAVVLRDQ
jgi:hypothetical protein